jgi:serine/threonine protein kinase
MIKDLSNFVQRLYVFEFCAASLLEYCEGKYQGPMPDEIDALIQMENGLHYIHSRELIHNNLKPQNILIPFDNPVQLKLADFGYSPLHEPDSNWTAPELHQTLQIIRNGRLYEQKNAATRASDTFALGCIFFFFLMKIHPFGTDNISYNICIGTNGQFGHGIEWRT